MITRLKISGFKNLEDVELHFGAFACIAGRNGVGKSNLFDAIMFLKEAADRPLLEAATLVRGGDPIKNLFTHGKERMSFEIDFFIPSEGTDEFGRSAVASTTFLTYQLQVGYVPAAPPAFRDNMRVISEELTYVRRTDGSTRLCFAHSPEWLQSVWIGSRRSPYLSTDLAKGVVRLHQDRTDKTRGGRPWEFPLAHLSRTALSSATNAQESPTLVLARQAMKNSTLLQLEPTSLRLPDSFQDKTSISAAGRHLPAALYRIAKTDGEDAAYSRVANRLASVVDEVDSVRIDVNEERRLYTLVLRDQDSREFPAGSLSDGTLRFLALSILEQDPERSGVICLEEPENGIHPEKIASMLELLQDIAVDPEEPVDETNPLQQVLINTHSPLVVQMTQTNSILFAKKTLQGLVFRRVGTAAGQRKIKRVDYVSKGEIMNYLDPLRRGESAEFARQGTLFEQLEFEF